MKINSMRKSLTIDEGTLELLKETQRIIHKSKKVDFDLKDIVHLIFSKPERAAEFIGNNL